MGHFSARQYNEVARIIHEARAACGEHELYEIGYRDCAEAIQKKLCAMLTADNPRFDAERFNAACEPKSAEERLGEKADELGVSLNSLKLGKAVQS